MQFEYLGLQLDLMMNMKAAMAHIKTMATKAHSCALAVSYYLHHNKRHSNPIICNSPVEMLNL